MPVPKHLLDMLMEMRAQQKAATPRAPYEVARVGRGGGAVDMPVYDRGDDLTHAQKAADITAYTERGEQVPSYLFQGLGPVDIVEALGVGGQLRGMGGEPVTQFMTRPEEATVQFPVHIPELTPEEARMRKAEMLDEYTQKSGGSYPPGTFDRKSAAESIQILGDQLRARRAAALGRAGDPSIWMGAFTTGI